MDKKRKDSVIRATVDRAALLRGVLMLTALALLLCFGLCQFFLSSIENFVCMVRQFSVFYPIATSSSPGKPCHFVGQGLSNSQI